MNLDVRIPVGWMFAAMGSLLAVYGFVKGIRIDLIWGCVLVAASGCVLGLAYRGTGGRGHS